MKNIIYKSLKAVIISIIIFLF